MGRACYPTAKTPEKLLTSIIRAVSDVRDGFEVGGACVAVPGLLLSRQRKVVYSPNLHAVEGIPLKDELEPKLGLPLNIENDDSAAAWGEFRVGVGKGTNHLVFVGLGTGTGGGIFFDGQLLQGAQGAGGELGHVTVQATEPRCACCNRGCLEAFASGSAIGRRAPQVASERMNSALGQLAAQREVLGEDVARLPRDGDEAALSVLKEVGRWLGIELASFVNVFNPEVVVVGGGAMRDGGLMLKRVREEICVPTLG